MRRHAEEPTHLLDLKPASLKELALLIVPAEFVDLEPALKDCRSVASVGAAMGAFPLVSRVLCRLGRKHLIGREDHAGPGTVAEVSRPVDLTRPSQADRVAGELDRAHAVHAVVAHTPHRHHRVLRVDRRRARCFAVRVPQPVVLQLLGLHPARMQRHDLADRPARVDLLVEGEPVREQVQHHLLSPLERGLPRVRLRVQDPIKRMLAGDFLAATR